MFYTKKWGMVSSKAELYMLNRAEHRFEEKRENERLTEMIFICVDDVTGKRLYWRGRRYHRWTDYPWKDAQGHRYRLSSHRVHGLKRIQ